MNASPQAAVFAISTTVGVLLVALPWFERTNIALRSRGFSEIAPHVLESMPREPQAARLSQPPGSPSSVPPSSKPTRGNYTSAPPTSDVVARNSGSPPGEGTPGTRSRALARLFGRR